MVTGATAGARLAQRRQIDALFLSRGSDGEIISEAVGLFSRVSGADAA